MLLFYRRFIEHLLCANSCARCFSVSLNALKPVLEVGNTIPILKMKKLRHKIVKESLLAQSALVISYLPLIIKGSYPGVWFRARYPGLHRDRCLLPQLLLATQSYLAESSLPNTYESMRYLKKHILPSIHLSTSSSSPPYSSDNCLSQWGT